MLEYVVAPIHCTTVLQAWFSRTLAILDADVALASDEINHGSCGLQLPVVRVTLAWLPQSRGFPCRSCEARRSAEYHQMMTQRPRPEGGLFCR